MASLSSETKIIGGIGILTFVVLVGGIFFLSLGQSQTQTQESNVPEDQIISRTSLHWHPRLDIYIKGEKQEIPTNIGIGAVHQEIHTHDEDAKDGVLHMEMAGLVTRDETELGRFFKIWGKEFSKDQIFEYKTGSEGKVKMFVNGKENNDFEKYQMKDGDKIEIKYE
ncbi:MAG: hypothetical protein A3C30_01730 [Candidatus Levybacteria bacterium RIFCSPHIGHO2_02_FULL_40_18]|nr:MAG: hypothetical protein A2869_01295 [Candidatus Levybacteria bacterium RIFCSPHIGHO2_01_FULL_40_58]OGH26713.1 MAG: hypothetical protein A3C30_01730 [Candidatus Levybacteria bacterium RIFCSPHIGHO2_02_FULL_40_18]OGH31648.1 MAG: hypothetical protein A3E43_01450 [Candidatus Levybacteria bacterium RIFCSPHIGHO2_12_FULL_40_31]OGH40276.1 MAG: hypothetical protein A2894_02465 [Candidatus Levybacteria bacterium RIFCSPLOWO2_01_FULL_40_64]OGH48724.1 MAG: hypothetical protein A3I54_03625 [Candidatus Lev